MDPAGDYSSEDFAGPGFHWRRRRQRVEAGERTECGACSLGQAVDGGETCVAPKVVERQFATSCPWQSW